MKKSVLLLILSVTSFSYASYCIYEMVWLNEAPAIIECIGIKLNSEKKYSISNSTSRSSDTMVLDYPQGRGILPNSLGLITYNPTNSSFELTTSNEIITPKKDYLNNPFGALSRTTKDSIFQKPAYFGPNSVISSEILHSGIKFNTAFGDRSSRVSLRLSDFRNETFVTTSTEGVGTKYELQKFSPNHISVVCDDGIKNDRRRIFYFENAISAKCENTIEILPETAFSFSYRVLDKDGRLIAEGNDSNPQFETGGILFRIYTKFSRFDVGFLFFSLIVLFGFQFFFIMSHVRGGTPPVRSIIAIRLLLNCLAFLSVPLYLTALLATSNRWLYLVCLLVLNASYFTSKTFLHSSGFELNIYREAVIWTVLCVLPVVMYLFASNESLFGIPVLHFQKLTIIGLIFATNGDFFRRIPHGYWVRSSIILAFALLLSFVTSDIGSLLYTLIAFVIIEIVRKSISLRTVVLSALLLTVAIFVCYHLGGSSFTDRKLYRLVAPYTSPADEKLAVANEADRETYSNLHLIQKNLFEGSVPEMKKIVVPLSVRSTSFSDYAVFWSLIFGKGIFAVLFFIVQFMILFEFAFLLIISIRPVRINENQAFLLPVNREAEFVRFLLAFAIVTFAYPVLSNLFLVPLTGQSIPCLSISMVEVIFLPFFLIPIASIFTNPKYVGAAPSVTYSFFDVLVLLRFIGCFSVVAVLAGVTLKAIDIKTSPGVHRWQKSINENDRITTHVNPSDKESLIKAAYEIIGDDELTSVPAKKKPYLKNLASLHYLGLPFNQLHFESSFFQNSSRSVAIRMNLDSRFSERTKTISGPFQPFGVVTSYNQIVNGKNRLVYTNDYYASIPQDAASINNDLSAELSRELSGHLQKIGGSSNIGSILIVKNDTGAIIANSTFPLIAEVNSNEIHYNIGSLKKILTAYCALVIDPEYKNKVYNNKSFQDFLKWSDDGYAAALLKDLMLNHEQEFKSLLFDDLGLPLTSSIDDAYFDEKPDVASYSKPLDRKNEIYRYSIGQQKPYQFIRVLEWYSRVASGKKVRLSYNGRETNYKRLSIAAEDLNFLKEAMNEVLSGTAAIVGDALARNGLQASSFGAKTGTAESSTKLFNSSSSFVLINHDYTFGIMLNGKIPSNSQNLAAKDLMVTIIPILKKYSLL